MTQRYVSDELTHFVGQHDDRPDQQYERLIKILKSGSLLAGGTRGPFGNAFELRTHPDSDDPNSIFVPSVVCFCDIPVADLGIHIDKFSSFGLAFERNFLVGKGASPILYVAKNALTEYGVWGWKEQDTSDGRQQHFVLAIKKFLQLKNDEFMEAVKSDDLREELSLEIHHVLQFFETYVLSNIKFFDDQLATADPNNYYMEREWRVPVSVEFTLPDVTRIIMPEGYARRFRDDLPDYYSSLHLV